MIGAYSTKKKELHFLGNKTSLGKKCIYGMFILSFKKNYKNYQIKKIVISGGGHK